MRRWTRESASPDALAAMQCGLGALGLVYDVTLEVEPRYEVLLQTRVVHPRSLQSRGGTWQRFLAVRERVDPDGVFLNDFLREWFEVPVRAE